MDIEKVIEKNKRNIWQAIDEYKAHAYNTDVLDDVTDAFVERLAKDNAYAKSELRELFHKSQVWNEELDALIINGTRTHNPNYDRIRNLADKILASAYIGASDEKMRLLNKAVNFFADPNNPETLNNRKTM